MVIDVGTLFVSTLPIAHTPYKKSLSSKNDFCWLRLVNAFRTFDWAELEQDLKVLTQLSPKAINFQIVLCYVVLICLRLTTKTRQKIILASVQAIGYRSVKILNCCRAIIPKACLNAATHQVNNVSE